MPEAEHEFGSLDAMHAAREQERPRVINVDSNTRALGIIVWSPVWISVLPFLGYLGMPFGAAGPFLFVAAAVALPVLAGSDRAELRRRGSPVAPSPLLMLGTPLAWLVARWLLLRPVRGAHPLVPLLTFLAQLAVLALIALFFAGVTGLLTSVVSPP